MWCYYNCITNFCIAINYNYNRINYKHFICFYNGTPGEIYEFSLRHIKYREARGLNIFSPRWLYM